MKNLRRIIVLAMAVIAVLMVGCKSKESKDDDGKVKTSIQVFLDNYFRQLVIEESTWAKLEDINGLNTIDKKEVDSLIYTKEWFDHVTLKETDSLLSNRIIPDSTLKNIKDVTYKIKEIKPQKLEDSYSVIIEVKTAKETKDMVIDFQVERREDRIYISHIDIEHIKQLRDFLIKNK